MRKTLVFLLTFLSGCVSAHRAQVCAIDVRGERQAVERATRAIALLAEDEPALCRGERWPLVLVDAPVGDRFGHTSHARRESWAVGFNDEAVRDEARHIHELRTFGRSGHRH
jgi:hypothetical protein